MKLFMRALQAIIGSSVVFMSSALPVVAASAPSAGAAEAAHPLAWPPFLVIAVILVVAKIWHLIERVKQPPVVGELLAGILLGNLTLVGISAFKGVNHNELIEFLAELGVVILLFQIGLESNVRELTKVGARAFIVAMIGAFVPFLAATYLVGPLLLPGQSSSAYLFLGASLAATSVGITARIFKDMGLMKTQAAQVVLGAAVIDDIIGLVILAVISALAGGQSITALTVGMIVFKSFAFLVGSVVLGQFIAPWVSSAFSKIHTGQGTKFTLAISFGLSAAAAAQMIGLEPIIGAFAAGLALDPVHFSPFHQPRIVNDIRETLSGVGKTITAKIDNVLDHHADRHVDELIEPLAFFLVPIFFVTTGMGVDLSTLMQPRTLLLAGAMTVVAIIGKVTSGIFISGKDRLTVGLAMVPRGEVGLIFAAIGQGMGVLSDELFSVIVLTVLLTTVVGPAMLTQWLERSE